MDLLEFIRMLEAAGEADVREIYVEDEDGELREFDLVDHEETFDGWDTLYPACIGLKAKKD